MRIMSELERAKVKDVPSHMAIYRALVRHQLIEPKAARKRLKDYTHWERARPMELWQMDIVGGVLLDDGTECKILTGVDDHSRFCVCVGILVRATARPVCGATAADRVRTRAIRRPPIDRPTESGDVPRNLAARRGCPQMSHQCGRAPPCRRAEAVLPGSRGIWEAGISGSESGERLENLLGKRHHLQLVDLHAPLSSAKLELDIAGQHGERPASFRGIGLGSYVRKAYEGYPTVMRAGVCPLSPKR